MAVPVACLWLCGCGGGDRTADGLADDHPLLAQARQLEKANDIDGAIRCYEQALRLDPDLAKAHQMLGLHYDGARKDYLRAVYHFRRCLEIEPDAEKRDIIQELISRAEVDFAAKFPEKAPELVKEVSRLQQENRGLREDLDRMRQRVREMAVQLQEARAVGSAPPGEPVDPERAESVRAEAFPTTYTVVSGDNLSAIAAKVYKDRSQWRRIYDANRDRMGRPEDLKVGQVLRIPPPP